MAEFPDTAVPNLKELSNALDAILDWHTLGIKLGLETDELRRIEEDYPHDNAECKSEMLACCFQSDNPPTWKKMLEALCQMGEHQSADKIRRKRLMSMEGGVPNLRDLSLLPVPNWYLLGLQLGVSGDELDLIERNYPRDNNMCKLKMFGVWLRVDSDATFGKLARALSTVGKRSIAKSMCIERGIPLTVLGDTPVSIADHLPPPTLPPDSCKGNGDRVTHTPKDQASRIAKEYLRIRNIKGKFQSLVTLCHRNMKGKIIDMQDVRVFLAFCYLPKDDSNDCKEVDATDFVDKVLGTAQNLGDVLVALRRMDLLNYKNYSILRSLINCYANDDQELNDKMKEYEEEVVGYAVATKMQEYVDLEFQQYEKSEPDPELFKMLSLKVEENVTEHTLEYVKEVWDSLAHRLKLPHSALLFERVAVGCMEILWIVPSHITKFIVRRAQENGEYFREKRVLRVTIANRCIYEGEAPIHENLNEKNKDPWEKRDRDDENLGGLQAHEVGHEVENINETTDLGRKRHPDEQNSPWLQTPEVLHMVVQKEEHPVHKNTNEEADTGRKRDPAVRNKEGPQVADYIHEEELLLPESVCKTKDPNTGMPGGFNEGNSPTPEVFEGSSDEEHKDEAEALPEHELRLRSAMAISSNYSLLWQYLDPSQLLPKLFEKFLITEGMKEKAESYSQYTQTTVILRGLFDDYCPANRLFKLCDTLDTIPGQEHLGRKLLQDYKHPSTLIKHQVLPNKATTHSEFMEISQQFQQLQHEVIDLLDKFPNALVELKLVLATLDFPRREGKVVALIDPHSYENASTVQELFELLALHWNPLSTDLLSLLLETSGCSMAATKIAEFTEARSNKGNLVLCVRQMPSLVDFRSVHNAPLSRLQSLHHSLLSAQSPKHQITSSRNAIRISVEVDQNHILLSDYERINTALSGLFWMPKAAFVFAGLSQQPLMVSWLTIPEFLECSWGHITDISGHRQLADNKVTRIAVGQRFYQCPTIKEVELWEASCYGLLDKTILLTCIGTNVNFATVLYVACQKGHCDIVECLLRANADVNLQKNDGTTPLYVACQNNCGDVVEHLLKANADVNLQRKDGTSPLFIACQKNHGEIVDRLLIAKADVNLQRENGGTALHIAAAGGHEDVIELLLEANMNPDVKDKDGGTPLCVACQNNCSDVVDRLLKAKADVNLQLKDGTSPLFIACQENHGKIVDHLLIAKADVNLQGEDGATPLYVACQNNCGDVMERLLKANADVNLQRKTGGTPLYVACSKGYAEIVDRLLIAQADVNLQLKDGCTPLMVASQRGHSSVVRILLQAGATVNTTDQYGSTALLIAAELQHGDIVELLIQANADPNLKDKDQETALMMAAWKGCVEMVKMLIQHGASVILTNKNGLTALELASLEGHAEVCQELLTAKLHESGQEEEEEPQPPQPFEWTEDC